MKPGKGKIIVQDEKGQRVRPWQESATNGPVGQGSLVKGHDLTPVLEDMKATAPPIVKTSGLAKTEKLGEMLDGHIKSWRAMLGRPLLVGDLSPEMRRVFHLDGLKLTAPVTRYHVTRAAKFYLQEAENQMRAEQNRRVTKEPFYVPAGVR